MVYTLELEVACSFSTCQHHVCYLACYALHMELCLHRTRKHHGLTCTVRFGIHIQSSDEAPGQRWSNVCTKQEPSVAALEGVPHECCPWYKSLHRVALSLIKLRGHSSQ